MGATYKALDVNLRFAVTLKVFNAQLIGDESAVFVKGSLLSQWASEGTVSTWHELATETRKIAGLTNQKD
jgi:hypothetical protein